MDADRPPAPVAVVGHVEWVTHALGSVPARGHIADLRSPLQEPAGGGGVAALALARAGHRVLFFTALGDDGNARAARTLLTDRGVEVIAADRTGPQTPVLSITEPSGERTIMVVGDRLQPRAADPLPWDRLAECSACYYAAEDPAALAHARSAGVLVVTARRAADIAAAGIRPDVVVGSGADPDEDPSGLPAAVRPRIAVTTRGAEGGVVSVEGAPGSPYRAAAVPGPVVDTYGCGDTFAACLAGALGAGDGLDEAVAGAARYAAMCATWRGGAGPAA